jgi:hypothetical protein
VPVLVVEYVREARVEIIGVVLAVVGIVLTVLLSGPILILMGKAKAQIQQWTIDRQVDRRCIKELREYAYEEWHQAINVDSAGNARHNINARLINKGRKDLTRLRFPIYADAEKVSEADVQGWARIGRHVLKTELEDWKSQPKARGLLVVTLDPAVKQGDAVRLRWGYTLPRTFQPGDEYYNWDWANEVGVASGTLTFSKEWKILYARWTHEPAGAAEPPEINGSTITWKVRFPERSSRIRIEIGLDKTD